MCVYSVHGRLLDIHVLITRFIQCFFSILKDCVPYAGLRSMPYLQSSWSAKLHATAAGVYRPPTNSIQQRQQTMPLQPQLEAYNLDYRRFPQPLWAQLPSDTKITLDVAGQPSLQCERSWLSQALDLSFGLSVTVFLDVGVVGDWSHSVFVADAKQTEPPACAIARVSLFKRWRSACLVQSTRAYY